MAKVRLTTTIDEELLERIKITAIKEKTSVAKIIEKLLAEYLNTKQAEQ
ncbi:MAG: ribbon-helix-helix protein, CopG family [Ruminococcus sp.]|nr:ribbon-helix-helix protein, CopG family [Ruminococcus sp.]